MPPEKIRQDSNFPFGHYILRPPALWVASKCRVSANTVTWIGFVVGVAGLGLLATGWYWGAITGAVLVLANLFCDHVDGPVSRITGTASLHGQWLDGFSGYVVEMGVPVVVGVGLLVANVNAGFLIIGLGLSLVRCFSRLMSAYHNRVFGENIVGKEKQSPLYKAGLWFLSLDYPLLLLAAITNTLAIYFAAYLLAAMGELGLICLKSYQQK